MTWRRPLLDGIEHVSLNAAEQEGVADFRTLPASLRVLAEDALRHGDATAAAAIAARSAEATLRFHPARILMQDSSGIPVLADLAALRDAAEDPTTVEPAIPVDIVVDHSVEVDRHGTPDAEAFNLALEFRRNDERYRFLRWAESAFRKLRVIPPGAGICHQMNLEILADVVVVRDGLAFPDSMLGTDSHSTMVNALGVLGWGVGGIEALGAMLGRAVAMRVPKVVGVMLAGRLAPGVTATDLALAMTERLRAHGVVGKIVEFDGAGLDGLSLADRATIANMAPEYGATAGFFPIDGETLRYLRLTGRAETQVALVETYAKTQGLWRADDGRAFDETLAFDLSAVEPCVAGPSRPTQRRRLTEVPASLPATPAREDTAPIVDGDIVLAAITSCTNTANPASMLRAGLLARAARQRGLTARPWVKASLQPGSRAVTDYLAEAGLLADLEALGFALVGHGCMTCMGNSGPLDPAIEAAVARDGLQVAAVLSGNRNFEGRIHPACRLSYLASPPLVIAYALAGHLRLDLTRDPIGTDAAGKPVLLSEIWPDDATVAEAEARIRPELYSSRARFAFAGPPAWRALPAATTSRFAWEAGSTFLRPSPFATGALALPSLAGDVTGARILVMLGDDVTTDHISPVSRIGRDSEAGQWLIAGGVPSDDLQSYSARRVNHDVMARGTFANIRLRNRLVPDCEGGVTRLLPQDEVMTIYAAARAYQAAGVPVVVIGGRNYGAGSARDWAAKGTRILNIRAVIAESFERIHRANLVAMGVLPLLFPPGETQLTLGLTGTEEIDLPGLREALRPDGSIEARFRDGNRSRTVRLLCAIATEEEAQDLLTGGILPGMVARFGSGAAPG
ncbi:aconitate hydratase AcnA [Roseomonas sp. HJA6]|uniref:Aconitate hydratase n=1 Tax=Roseomonas alba TaxID=2846776 RepID=A0ABS7AG52_9PROT|nr:aconitate hydratase AcnA [Neoroseomonas alba]MBW6401275.1 aconitate hydratase AcnA [Neoroseomonas alba]